MNKRVTIRDILNSDEFRDFVVLAGDSALDKEVHSITIMDSPNPFPWSVGGEIVLSSGYIFKKHESEFEELIRKMSDAGIVALFIKLKRYFDYIPQNIIDLGNEIGFVIVSVPVEMSFVDVINPTLSKIINFQSEVIRKSEKILSDFTSLVMNEGDTLTIIKVISEILGEEICYYDMKLNEMYHCKSSCYKDRDFENININQLLVEKESYRVSMNNKIFGYIVFLGRKKGDIYRDEFNALAHANTALILDTQKKLSSMQIENRHKNEFVRDIITNNIRSKMEIEKRAQSFGWTFKETFRTLIVDIDNFKDEYTKMGNTDEKRDINNDLDDIRDNILSTAVRVVKSYFVDSVYVNLSDTAVFLIQNNREDKIDEILEKMSEEIRNTIGNKFDFTVSIGIGESQDDIINVYRSYKEAQMAIKIGRTIYNSNFSLHYKDLGVYRILYSIYQNEDVLSFCKSSIGKVLDYDGQYNTELFSSLQKIADCDWNLKIAAEELYIHYNTMKYRYKKIAEILDKDLNKTEVRTDISLALKIYKMSE